MADHIKGFDEDMDNRELEAEASEQSERVLCDVCKDESTCTIWQLWVRKPFINEGCHYYNNGHDERCIDCKWDNPNVNYEYWKCSRCIPTYSNYERATSDLTLGGPAEPVVEETATEDIDWDPADEDVDTNDGVAW